MSNPTVTAGQRGRRKTKSNVPDIDWKANNGHLLWRVIEELEKPANFKVLFGKKEKGENTSGDRKVTVPLGPGMADAAAMGAHK